MLPRRWPLPLLLASLLTGAACGPPRPRENVLLVVIDTLRADHLSCYGYERATSPNLDALAANGVLFEAAQSPRAKTTPSVATLMTGQYPHDHGVRDLTQALDDRAVTLAERLGRAGYESAAIVGNYVLKRSLSGLDQGFDTWIEELPDSMGVPPDDVPERRASSLTDGALELLQGGLLGGEAPWFLYLHYMDPHGLYDPPEEHRIFHAPTPRPIEEPVDGGRLTVATYNVPADAWTEDGRIDAAKVIDRYDGEVHHVDAQLGRLFDALRAKGALENTWVVVVSDHGESFGEHDYWFEHGRYAYQATCRVPLIVHPPLSMQDRPTGQRRQATVSLADVAPTLAGWLGIDFEVEGAPAGRLRTELLHQEPGAGVPAFSEKVEAAKVRGAVQTKAVRRERFKLLQRYVPGREGVEVQEELYDLQLDPAEERNLLSAPLTEAAIMALARLRIDLERFLEADVGFEDLARTLAERRAELEARDPEAHRTLQGLGYR